jgi:hypothetical protein
MQDGAWSCAAFGSSCLWRQGGTAHCASGEWAPEHVSGSILLLHVTVTSSMATSATNAARGHGMYDVQHLHVTGMHVLLFINQCRGSRHAQVQALGCSGTTKA